MQTISTCSTPSITKSCLLVVALKCLSASYQGPAFWTIYVNKKATQQSQVTLSLASLYVQTNSSAYSEGSNWK